MASKSRANSSVTIPPELIANVKKGDCVLFLGADIPLKHNSAPPSRPELANKLMQEFELVNGVTQEELIWPATAQTYLNKYRNDRHGLISFLHNHCSIPSVKPGPIHANITRIGFKVIVNAWYDDVLENALRDSGHSVIEVVRDSHLPYVSYGGNEIIVVKLFGSLKDPDSLVLDLWDHDTLMDRLDRKLELVASYCTVRPPLFLGFDLSSAIARRLYIRASRNTTGQMKRAYVVWPDPAEELHMLWQHHNVEFLKSGTEQFLSTLSSEVYRRTLVRRNNKPIRRPPYKSLYYYDVSDSEIFCGRDTESQIVKRLILSYRYMVLFGPSGAGKTSLLLAGVVPLLAIESYKYVYARLLDDPLTTLRKEVAAISDNGDWGIGSDLKSFMNEVLSSEDRLVVLLDNFEEVFLRVGSGRRKIFFEELAEAITQLEREVRIIISIREDYLARLDELRFFFPNIFSNTYRLTEFDQANARVAITEPAARVGITVEPQLVDALVGGKGHITKDNVVGDLVEVGGNVPPAALQIVLDRLYRESLPSERRQDGIPAEGMALTLESYHRFRYGSGHDGKTKELMGAQAILATYLDETLAMLSEYDNYDSRGDVQIDRDLAEAILKTMVTSVGTKSTISHGEILNWLQAKGIIDGNDKADQLAVYNTRRGLEDLRLIRSYEKDKKAVYELAHDHLAREIAARMSRDELKEQEAREMLKRQLDNWEIARSLIPIDVLKFLYEHRQSLLSVDENEAQLLYQSALATSFEVAFWANFATSHKLANDVFIEGLKNPDFRVRANTVTALAETGSESNASVIARMMDDPYPQVRVRAVKALESLGLKTWQKYIEILNSEVFIPKGTCIIGDDYLHPAHEVSVESFYISRYFVTNADYSLFMQDHDRSFIIPKGKSHHPVTGINLNEARAYTKWAEMRLPTEAEWEKAAGWDESNKTKRTYPWGNEFDEGKLNQRALANSDTSPVGSYSPDGDSFFGIADMAGNAWEFTSSHFNPYPYVENDEHDESFQGRHIARGGGFSEMNARVSYRYPVHPDESSEYFGIRTVFDSTFMSEPV